MTLAPRCLYLLRLVVVLACCTGTGVAQTYKSPADIAVSGDGTRLFAAAAGTGELLEVNVRENAIVRSLALPQPPSGLALSPDESILYVTVGASNSALLAVDAAQGKIRATVRLGHTPCAPVVSADGRRLYACNRFTNDVSAVDLENGKEITRIKVTREPVAAALTPDGRFLLVANHLPAGAADGDRMNAVIDVIDTQTLQRSGAVSLPDGSTGVRGLCVSPDGRFLYVTHTLARYKVPTTQVDRGWINTNAISVISTADWSPVNAVLLDDVDRGAANPWGVGCTADGASLCVALAGTHEIAVIDLPGLHGRLQAAERGERVTDATASAADVPYDLSFLTGLKRIIPLDGKGPRALVLKGGVLYTAMYFSGRISMVRISAEPPWHPGYLALGSEPEMDSARRGELLFNDASVCFQQWQSCASCHPEGRTDGLNWDLMNDGIGNTKQVKSMLFAHQTPPAMISGIRASAEVAVRSGMRYILFSAMPDSVAQDIDAYLKSMQPAPSPHLENGHLSAAAQRGERIFAQAGCLNCHSGPNFTNMKRFDLGMGKNQDRGVPFDVPALRECWRTAPYLYDGRAATLEEVVTVHNAQDQHGRTSGLTEEEIADLIAYVLSL